MQEFRAQPPVRCPFEGTLWAIFLTRDNQLTPPTPILSTDDFSGGQPTTDNRDQSTQNGKRFLRFLFLSLGIPTKTDLCEFPTLRNSHLSVLGKEIHRLLKASDRIPPSPQNTGPRTLCVWVSDGMHMFPSNASGLGFQTV